jgi:type II secretory pathway component PulF
MKPWKYKAVDRQETVHEGVLIAADLTDAIHKLLLKKLELLELTSISRSEYSRELMKSRLQMAKAKQELQNEVYTISEPSTLFGKVFCGFIEIIRRLFFKV